MPPQPSELIQQAVEVVELERRALALATAPPQLVDDLAGAPQLHLVGNVDTLAVHLAVVAALGLAAPRVALVVARAWAKRIYLGSAVWRPATRRCPHAFGP